MFSNPLIIGVLILLLTYLTVVGYVLYLSPQARNRKVKRSETVSPINHNMISMGDVWNAIEKNDEKSEQDIKTTEYKPIDEIISMPALIEVNNVNSQTADVSDTYSAFDETEYLPLISQDHEINLNATTYTEEEQETELDTPPQQDDEIDLDLKKLAELDKKFKRKWNS